MTPLPTFKAIRLLIQPAGAQLALPNQPEVIVGRADASSQFYPDVDLDPFDALNNGVSRRHARVLIQSGQVTIEDLDTANGTSVNRQRLTPNRAQLIRDGDELRFGKLVATVRLG
jgi:pSer/pThr/pTyr-binding forkhead associated (FHA) protein